MPRRKRREDTITLRSGDVSNIAKGVLAMTRLYQQTGIVTIDGVFCNGDWGAGVIPLRFDYDAQEYVVEWTR